MIVHVLEECYTHPLHEIVWVQGQATTIDW